MNEQLRSLYAFTVVRCGGIILHGSTSSVALADLEVHSSSSSTGRLVGIDAARVILREAALRPQAMPTEATKKRARATTAGRVGSSGRPQLEGPVIPVGFVFADRLHVVRGLGREIFEPVCETVTADELSDGRALPDTIEFSGKLRPEQERVVGEFVTYLRNLSSTGAALGMITADPGSGKTLMFIALVLLHLRTSALIVVKGRKIVQQWCRRLMDFGFPAESVGIVMGGKTVVAGRHVVVASVDTIVSRGGEFPRSLWQRFGVLCFDEAHHITAQTFVSTYLRVAHARYVIGLTGTPDRKDGTTAQMRWFVGPGVASMENQTPTEVRIAECTFGATPVSRLPGGGGGGRSTSKKTFEASGGGGGGEGDDAAAGGGEYNTAKMISDLSSDRPRARWIARLVAGLIPRREKIVVLTGRTDARDELDRLLRQILLPPPPRPSSLPAADAAAMAEKGAERGVDACLPDEMEMVPVMQTRPRPDTPFFSCLRRIDELYFRAETEEEKTRPDTALASRLRDRAARLRLRFEITLLRRQVKMLFLLPPSLRDYELAQLRTRCTEKKATMLARYPFLRTSRIRVDEAAEGPIWDYYALEDMQDHVELAAPDVHATSSQQGGDGEEEEDQKQGLDEQGDEPDTEEEEEESIAAAEPKGGQEKVEAAVADAVAASASASALWLAREKASAEQRMRETGLYETLKKEQLRIPGFDIVEEIPGAFRKRPLCAVMGSGQTELQAAMCEQARVIFSTVHLVREAWDCSGLDTVVLAFPTVDIRQVLGRPRRLTPKMIETRAGALVVDILDTIEPFSNYIWGRMRIYKQPKFHAKISWRQFENEHELLGTEKSRATTDREEDERMRVGRGGLWSQLQDQAGTGTESRPTIFVGKRTRR